MSIFLRGAALRMLVLALGIWMTTTFSVVALAQANNFDALISDLKGGDVTKRSAAAASLVEGWNSTPSSLPNLIAELNAFDRGAGNVSLSAVELANLLPITDVVRAIVINKRGAIQKFRELAKEATIRTLVRAARSESQNLRINATYILANVTDNKHLCVVLDNLRDKNLSETGRINLLQVASAVSSYAYSENVDETKKTIELLKAGMSTWKERDGLGLVAALSDSIDKSIHKNQALPSGQALDLSYCATTYKYQNPAQ